MESEHTCSSYPPSTVFLSNLHSLSIYALGFYILSGIGLLFSFLYLAYAAILEFRLLRYHCTDCYYYGRTCGFGKGKISALLFRKGDPARFCSKGFGWKDLLPDMLVSLVPLLTGIVLLILRFDLLLLSAMLLLVLLTTTGNSMVRGKLTCNHCRQRDMGCPAQELFNKKNE
ncbi:MAG: hypothetical protein U0T82_07675 [Bacteroidales bacterium]